MATAPVRVEWNFPIFLVISKPSEPFTRLHSSVYRDKPRRDRYECGHRLNRAARLRVSALPHRRASSVEVPDRWASSQRLWTAARSALQLQVRPDDGRVAKLPSPSRRAHTSARLGSFSLVDIRKRQVWNSGCGNKTGGAVCQQKPVPDWFRYAVIARLPPSVDLSLSMMMNSVLVNL